MAGTLPQGDGRSRALTITEITARIKQSLESNFQSVCVVGEISRPRRPASGHVYLTLKDENAVLEAVVWRGVAASLGFEPQEGMEVIAWGGIDVYPPRGSYQLIISRMEPRGIGALELAFRRLVEKLEKEGLFRPEIKKPLPPFPRRIGIVTSPTGAALRDIINVISRRYPPAELFLYPTRVQGEGAAAEIAGAIARLNQRMPDLDLIIVGRGGGSLEDLWAFNEEVVARAIHESRIPIVSAVGHEVDFSISDFAADVRAATPTEAGEIAVPDRAELLSRLRQQRRRLALALQNTLGAARRRLDSVASRPAFRRPEAILRESAQRADDALERLKTLVRHRLDLLGELLNGTSRRLESLGPLKVLARGYSLTFAADGRILRTVEDVRPGDSTRTRLHRGTFVSRVLETERGDE